MDKYSITGMSCAACAQRVEKTVSKVKGVNSCTVNLLTNSMSVSGSALPEDIISAVENAGYSAAIYDKEIKKTSKSSGNSAIIKRLTVSAILLFILMYISMGYGMFGFPLPAIFTANPAVNATVQMLLAALIMVINQKFFISGFKGIIKGAPNMDTLVALGSAASFIYSTANLFIIQNYLLLGKIDEARHILHDLYFEAAAMILVIITVGKLLEAISKGKTTNAIEALLKLQPKNASVISNGKEISIPADKVLTGDIFIVRPGESIPVDGIIIEGETYVDESALTGESIPILKNAGDKISAATVNHSGFIKCKATDVGENTAYAKIIKLVSDATATKAPISKIADKVSGIFVPIVLGIALITFAVWIISGETVGYSLARAVSVLVISCPCALGLATPVAVMVGSGLGAKNGILFKNAEVLEKTAEIKTAAFDKTGTLTEGKPKVTDIFPINISATEFLRIAASLEAKSEHPLARAITEKAEELNIQPFEVTDFSAIPGGGIKGVYNNTQLYAGNYNFISDKTNISKDVKEYAENLSNSGKTIMFFATGKNLYGIIAVADTLKNDAEITIKKLNKMGINTVMLTGDNKATAESIASCAGIKTVYAELLPEDKNNIINKLKQNGPVIMIGDGINDAPALTAADIGMAIGSGTDVAIEAADVVLMHNELKYIPAAITLARKTLSNIHGNLFWAFFYNALCIPLAAGVFVKLLSITVSPMLAAAAMCVSDICVVTNALRLNFVNIFDKGEKFLMKKVLIVEGMMCSHCENRVKTLLESTDGVKNAEVSHKNGTAIVTLSKNIPEDILISVIENAGYKVKGVK